MSKLIAIIEDNPDMRIAFGRLLCEEGFDVETFPDLDLFIESKNLERFDVIISDFLTPSDKNLDLNLEQAIDSFPDKKNVIVTSGFIDLPDFSKHPKVFSQIAKPLNVEDVVKDINKILSKRSF